MKSKKYEVGSKKYSCFLLLTSYFSLLISDYGM